MDTDDHAAVRRSPEILDKLFQSGYRFSFFQAVYILEKLYRGSAPPGEGGPLSQEMIRFRANPKLSFPAASIHHIEKKTEDNAQMVTGEPEIVQMVLSFMGLYGVIPI